MKVKLLNQLIICCFLFLGISNATAQLDCDCDFTNAPVCVITDDGSLTSFPNACQAECAGYGEDSLVDCDSGICSAIIIASQVDDEGFIWAFGSITTGDVISQFWTFGDGETSTEAAPVHTYTTPGLYLVTLTVTTADGCTATAHHFLYAGNCYNIIIAIPSGNSTYAFGSIANGTVLSYFWQFGDGDTSNEPAPVHTYPGSGIYDVSLTTLHEDSCTWTSTITLNVEGDCICPDIYDPVCVIADNGDIIEFDNFCFAECAGYGPEDIVPCDGVECSAEIIAIPEDDENFVWYFEGSTTGNVISYEWTFGDGEGSTEANPVHVYTTPGVYFVSLTIVTADGCTDTDIHILYAGNCYNIIIAIPSGNATYAFGSIANSGVLSYFWQFGDGETSSDPTPVHTYPSPGSYDVSLTTLHEDSCTWTSTITIEVAGDCICPDIYDPVCVLGDDGSIIEFDNICFAECAGYGPEDIVPCDETCFAEIIAIPEDDEGFVWYFEATTIGDVISYEWTFGDGESSTEANPVHVYTTPGVYFVSLTIVTADGCTYTDIHILYAGNCYNIIIALSSGNLTYSFGAIATGSPVSYFWEFGDGDTSNESAPVHTYPATGTYTVSLTTVHEDSCIWTSHETIVVGEDCVCPDVWDPVCVIIDNGEIYQFGNLCEAQCAGYTEDEVVPCDDCICTDEWDPVCVIADDGTVLVFSNLCEANCAGYGDDQIVDCENDCICTDEWDPVCVIADDGTMLVFSNLCEANCAGYGDDQIVDCENDCICTDEWDPVCVITDDGAVLIFSNLCEANCAGYGDDQIVDCDGLMEDEGPAETEEILHAIFDNTGFSGNNSPESIGESTNALTYNIANASVFPNPVSEGNLTIEVNMLEAADARIQMVSITGQVTNELETSLVSGKQQIEIDVNNLVNGIYFARIETAKTTYTMKFIKQ